VFISNWPYITKMLDQMAPQYFNRNIHYVSSGSQPTDISGKKAKILCCIWPIKRCQCNHAFRCEGLLVSLLPGASFIAGM
jgi:hypothetical protein